MGLGVPVPKVVPPELEVGLGAPEVVPPEVVPGVPPEMVPGVVPEVVAPWCRRMALDSR